jgi:hypothetical protein
VSILEFRYAEYSSDPYLVNTVRAAQERNANAGVLRAALARPSTASKAGSQTVSSI